MNTSRNQPQGFSVRLVLWLIFLALISIAAWAAYKGVREVISAWRVPGLENSTAFQPDQPGPFSPETSVKDLTQQGIDATRPIQTSPGPAGVPWDGSSRVNVLLMGLDYREWEEGGGPARADTLILFTFDPASLTAGMLSIPRDLWVNIPEYGYAKINTAYTMGVIYDHPGGGPGATLDAVEQFLGIEIPYYAQVDFNAFVRFIDEIDGVKVDVPEEILIDPVGPDIPRTLEPGVQVLPGSLALAYARARNTPAGDFDRAQRQQQVILAIRDRIVSLDMIPILITRTPVIFRELSAGINTNLTLEQIIRMGLAAQKVPLDSIKRLSIGYDDVTYANSPDGLFILLPDLDRVREVRDEMFAASPPVTPQVETRPLAELVREEDARIAVLNATSTPGLAANASAQLRAKNLNVAQAGNAQRAYQVTTVIDYTGNPYTLQYLVENFDIDPGHIFHSYNPESEVDIEINLGSDWGQVLTPTP